MSRVLVVALSSSEREFLLRLLRERVGESLAGDSLSAKGDADDRGRRPFSPAILLDLIEIFEGALSEGELRESLAALEST